MLLYVFNIRAHLLSHTRIMWGNRKHMSFIYYNVHKNIYSRINLQTGKIPSPQQEQDSPLWFHPKIITKRPKLSKREPLKQCCLRQGHWNHRSHQHMAEPRDPDAATLTRLSNWWSFSACLCCSNGTSGSNFTPWLPSSHVRSVNNDILHLFGWLWNHCNKRWQWAKCQATE